MALAVASSDLAAFTVVLPKNFTVNISRSENLFSPPSSSKFSDKSFSFDANAQFSPTSVYSFFLQNSNKNKMMSEKRMVRGKEIKNYE